MNPLVSIIVPVYNTEDYLYSCIESLVNQSYKNIEIILVNDGSTDNSPNIIKTFAEKDKRIKVINKSNEGVTIARKTGWQHSSGKYCLFIDSDDYIELKAIEYFINIISNKEYDFIVGNYDIIYNNGKIEKANNKMYPLGEISTSNYIDISLNKNKGMSSIWIGIFKSEVIKEEAFNIKKEIFRGEDGTTLLWILNNIESILITDYVFYHYVQRNDSVTHIKDIDIKYIANLYELQYNITEYKTEFLPILITKLLSYYYVTKSHEKERIKLRILKLYKKEVFKKLCFKSKIKYICLHNFFLEKILSNFIIHEK